MSNNEKPRFNWSVPGIALIVIGVLFLLKNFFHIHIDFDKIWPFFLILIGLSFLFPRIFSSKK
jgi:hypothetical protein